MKKAKRIIIFLTASSLILLTVMVIQQKKSGTELETPRQSQNSTSVEKRSTTQSSSSKTTTDSSMTLQPSEDIISENYMVQREEIDLYGVITASRNYKAEKRPLVIISHGFNNTLEDYDDYADALARLGFIVYRFDFYGGSTRSKSGGTDMLAMSVLT